MTSRALQLLTVTAAAALATTALAEGGTVTGKVEATPAKYLEETVVYLKDAKAEGAPRTVSMDQKNLKFVPRVLAIAKGDTVKFLNHDGVAHNVYSPDGEAYNLGTFKPGEERSHTFAQEGAYSQLCSIHPEMLGYIFAAPSRLAAAVDAKGHFTLKNVPPGTYKLAVWNSHLKAPDRSVTVAAGQKLDVNLSLKR